MDNSLLKTLNQNKLNTKFAARSESTVGEVRYDFVEGGRGVLQRQQKGITIYNFETSR